MAFAAYFCDAPKAPKQEQGKYLKAAADLVAIRRSNAQCH
jgi:hypothetical protein